MTPNGSAKTPEMWKDAGNDYFKRGEYEKAIKCYAQALQLDPEYLEAWNNMGLALMKMGKTEEAKMVNHTIVGLMEEKGMRNNHF
jgi:tetratricopeptide (TPR) repeat protein